MEMFGNYYYKVDDLGAFIASGRSDQMARGWSRAIAVGQDNHHRGNSHYNVIIS